MPAFRPGDKEKVRVAAPATRAAEGGLGEQDSSEGRKAAFP